MTLDPERFVVLLARQRTGTNALQSVLDRHPALACTREVFHPEPDEHEHLAADRNWFRFLQRRGVDGIVAAMTERDGKEHAFTEFLLELQAGTQKPRVLLDVKLNSTHHLDGPWREPLDDPAMFRFIRRHELRVLHLRRRNHLRTWLSLLTANRTGEWMRAGGSAAEPPPLALDPQELLRTLRRWQAQDEHVAERFPPGERCLRLEYEELFPRLGGGAAHAQLARIADWLGIDETFAQAEPEYRKQSARALTAVIENYGEVEAVLRDSEFAAFLDDEPAYR